MRTTVAALVASGPPRRQATTRHKGSCLGGFLCRIRSSGVLRSDIHNSRTSSPLLTAKMLSTLCNVLKRTFPASATWSQCPPPLLSCRVPLAFRGLNLGALPSPAARGSSNTPPIRTAPPSRLSMRGTGILHPDDRPSGTRPGRRRHRLRPRRSPGRQCRRLPRRPCWPCGRQSVPIRWCCLTVALALGADACLRVVRTCTGWCWLAPTAYGK
jgi:hypothetical protein